MIRIYIIALQTIKIYVIKNKKDHEEASFSEDVVVVKFTIDWYYSNLFDSKSTRRISKAKGC